MSRKTFIIAEKNYLIRRGLIATISELTQAEIVKEVEENEQLIKITERVRPDYLIVNPDFCKLCSTEMGLKNNFRGSPDTKIVGLLSNDTNDAFEQTDFDEVLFWNDDKVQVSEKLNRLFEEGSPVEDELTEREKDIVRNIALGQTNKEIADSLFISPHTVITHRKNITQKLGIKSVSGLTVYAILNNLIKVEEVK